MFYKTKIVQDRLHPLLDSLRTNDLNGVEKWMNDDDWQTLLQLLQIECQQNLSRLKNIIKKLILVPNPSSVSTNELSHVELEEHSSEWCCS